METSQNPETGRRLKYRPLLRYLGAHKLRLVIAFFSMILVGFFGSFNILLLKPGLEVILGSQEPKNTLT